MIDRFKSSVEVQIFFVCCIAAAYAEVSLGANQCCSSVKHKGLKPNKPYDFMSLCSCSDGI